MAAATEKSLKELTKEVKSSNSKLLKAQKETSRLLMTEEQRAAADEANQNRVEGGRKAWENRQSKQLDESKESTNESVGLLSKIANFMGLDRLMGAAQAEKANKKTTSDKKTNSYLKSIKDDIKKSAKDKMKAGAKFAVRTTLFGAAAAAAIYFLNHPNFEKMKKYIRNEIIPAIGRFYESMKKTLPEIIDSIKSFYKRLENGTKPLVELFTGAKDKEGNPIGLFDRIFAIFNVNSVLVTTLTTLAVGLTAAKVAKKLKPLTGAVSKLFSGLGTLAKKIPGLPKFGAGKAGGGVLSKIGDSASKTASNIGAKIKSILTVNGAKFVTPLSITSLSQEKVYIDK